VVICEWDLLGWDLGLLGWGIGLRGVDFRIIDIARVECGVGINLLYDRFYDCVYGADDIELNNAAPGCTFCNPCLARILEIKICGF
jgi:hypothetical protein